MNDFKKSTKLFLILTLLTGIIYPIVVTIISQVLFADKANGSLLKIDKQIIGSELISQKFSSEKYFWPRPSTVDHNPLSSGGSNLSFTSTQLKQLIEERSKAIKLSDEKVVPADLLTSSGSGLDPHISVAAAIIQSERVAGSRQMDLNKVRNLIAQLTESPQFGIFGVERINVLKLNVALDQLDAQKQ